MDDFATDLNTPRPVVAGGTGGSTPAAARAALDAQKADAGLESIAGLTTDADKMIYTTGHDAYAVTPLTAAGRALVDDANPDAQLTTLGGGGKGRVVFKAADQAALVAALGYTGDPSTQVSTLPSGLTIMSGSGSTSGPTAVTFPAAFPTACFQVVANHLGTGPLFCVVNSITTTGFSMRTFSNSGTLIDANYRYIAIGH